MKTYRNLFPSICMFENLLLASRQAQRGKRQEEAVAKFNVNLEKELFQLEEELQSRTYQPGPYHTFQISDPKPRMISAAPYRDRVVHHALCNIIAPILERSMIYDSYANRVGKGTHKAILRYQDFCRKNKYVLKCDIRKYFPSIDHKILKEALRRKITCPDTLWLIDAIIDNSNPQEPHLVYFPGDDLFGPAERRRGLPIGNLTSQLFGNFYLNAMDHLIKENLGCKYYIRYVDDFVIFHDDKPYLHKVKRQIELFLEKYRLILHPYKSKVFPVSTGIEFLGHRVFRDFRLLKKENVKRFKKRFQVMLSEYHAGTLDIPKANQRIQCWVAHASFSNTFRLRTKIFSEIQPRVPSTPERSK